MRLLLPLLLSTSLFGQEAAYQLTSPVGAQGFGHSVAAIGDVIHVGEPSTGSIHTFDARNGTFVSTTTLPGVSLGWNLEAAGSHLVSLTATGTLVVFDEDLNFLFQALGGLDLDTDMGFTDTHGYLLQPDGLLFLFEFPTMVPLLQLELGSFSVPPIGSLDDHLAVAIEDQVAVFDLSGDLAISWPIGHVGTGVWVMGVAVNGHNVWCLESNGFLHRYDRDSGFHQDQGVVGAGAHALLCVDHEREMLASYVSNDAVATYETATNRVGTGVLSPNEGTGRDLDIADGLVVLGDPEDSTAGPGAGLVSIYLLGEPLGSLSCPNVVNSTGAAATCHAIGSFNVANNQFGIAVRQLPGNESVLLLNAPALAFVAHPGGSDGHLCLGGGPGRHRSDLVPSAADGTVHLGMTLNGIPRPGGDAPVSPGETWHFQAWYRDGSSSNFSNVVTVAFQ